MTQAVHRVPTRTCVGCRRTDAQDQLLRVVAVEPVAADAAGIGGARRAVADPRRRLPGRGAWLHAQPACLAQAGRGLSRALKMSVPARDVEAIASMARAQAGSWGAAISGDAHERTKA